MRRLAVVGLGAMGRRVALRLLAQGSDVVVWNRGADQVDELVRAGARRAADPADAARQVEVVFTLVSDDRALRAVTEGPTGVAAGIGEGTLVQMSTVSLPAVHRVAEQLPAGAGLLDAPVLGSIAEVEAGTLRIYAGGTEDTVARTREALQALGTVLHVGPIGSGTAAKLVANSTFFGVLGLLGESLGFARRLGLSQDVALEVLSATPLAAQLERRRASLDTGEYPRRFALSLALKDADLIRDAAAGSGAHLPLGAAAREWLADAEAEGHGDRDYSALLDYILGQHPAAPPDLARSGRHDDIAQR